MLRKGTGHGPSNSSRYNDEKDEKGAKITSQKMERTKNTLLFLAVLFVVGVGALIFDSTDFNPSFKEGYLRARGLKKKDSASLLQYDSELPHNSIYRVSVKGADGDQVPLEQFAGMVSLVVNTACR
jgi:hypothetical protein